MLFDPGLVVKRTQDKGRKGFYESKSRSMSPGSKRSDNRLKRDLECCPLLPSFFFSGWFFQAYRE